MKWIEVRHLEQWADTIGSRTALSELVSALVRASASDINSFRFPTGDSAQAPGYDGSLEAKGIRYVPDGKSVWEFGTEADYLGKANKDYEKRSSNPLSVVLEETTFVFVTPRHWKRDQPSLEQWRIERTAEGPWKEVRVVDGVGLEDWLDQCAGVAAWAAYKLFDLRPGNGARSTDEFWEEYSCRFKPPLNEQVIVCGREEQRKLLDRIAGPPQVHLCQADSPEEAAAFIVAAIRLANPPVRKFLESRTLIVDTEQAARDLARSRHRIFLPRAGALGQSGLLASYNPTVVALGRDDPKREAVTVLERPTTYALGKALETMGYSPEAALQQARKCGRSVTIFARQIPSATIQRPDWDGELELIPALIAGAWDTGSAEDQAAVQTLAATRSYAEYEDKLLAYVHMQDPPIEREGTVWKLRAPVDAFVLLGRLIGRQHLARLEEVFQRVFSELDPSVDLPETRRAYAELSGKTIKHSSWLRDGLANTLLLFAVLSEQARLSIIEGAQPFVDRLVKALPGLNQDWRLLASLEKQLPLLMEAAPRPLILALGPLLEGDGTLIRPIFTDANSGLFSSSPHVWLLWALEVMAWDPEYLGRVSLLLARLARLDDPPGKLANRPINSLGQIFVPRHPCTNASLTQRLGVLDEIIKMEPAIAWKLVLTLLPAYLTVAQPTTTPRYREAGASEREPCTDQVVWQGYSASIQRALSLAGDDPQRWATLVESFPNFGPPDLERAFHLLEKFSEGAATDARAVVWSALNKLINRHRAFHEAAWAMDKSRLDRLELAASSLRPSDPLVRVAWLFNDYSPALPKAHPETWLADIEKARKGAVLEVIQSGGPSAVASLANRVAYPRLVAAGASKVIECADVFDSMLDASLGRSPKLNEFAMTLSAAAEARFKQEWKSRVLARLGQKHCTDDEFATLLLLWQDEPETWEFAASIGPEVERSYWQHKPAWRVQGNTEAIETAAKKYLSVGRAVAALEAIHDAADRISPEIIFELLDKAIEEVNSAPDKTSGLHFYDLQLIFDELDRRQDVAMIEIAKREYAYLPLLEHSTRSLTLHRMMADDAEFFVSVLCDVFKPATGEAPEPDQVRRARAQAGYKLLTRFSLVPGKQGGEIDPTVLDRWVENVRALAAERDRARIADQHIGHTLAHAPGDPDGGWPHRAVRAVIESLRSEDVEGGIEVERLNMRGGFTKAMYEGGKQERALAAEARLWAKAAADWPRTHALLNAIARMWDEIAVREDQEARQDQMRFE